MPLTPQTWPALEMLLEVADSSMAYRSRYFTILQPAPVLDLLMNEEANPRSLAFQMKDLPSIAGVCPACRPEPGGRLSSKNDLRKQHPICFTRMSARFANRPPEGLASGSMNSSPPSTPLCRLCPTPSLMLISVMRSRSGPHDLSRRGIERPIDYEDPVSVSHHLVRLTPRNLARTALPGNSDFHSARAGGYVNSQTTISATYRHSSRCRSRTTALVVEASSELEVYVLKTAGLFALSAVGNVVESLASDSSDEGLDAYQFVFGSQRVAASRELADYAREAFSTGRPLLEAVFDLMRIIHRDFQFDTKATEVTTPVQAFFKKRRGVCQDFAHLQIACMRSLGLPARYVSGYLRTCRRRANRD